MYHFHCHPHDTSCMCANCCLDGYALSVFCYTGNNLDLKLYCKIYFTSRMIFTFIVITTFHLAHVQILDGYPLCLLCYTGINLVRNMKVEIIHFHCDLHVPSCMCSNHYLDRYPIYLLCYTEIVHCDLCSLL